MQRSGRGLILASASPSRAAMLRAAGLAFEQIASTVDESAIKAANAGVAPAEIAAILARAKAEAVSALHPQAVVIGADQTLDLDGELLDKPGSRVRAREQLLRLSGGVHALHSALSAASGGREMWRIRDMARMTFRPYDAAFVDFYLDAAGDDVLSCVGACQIEGLGVHLFSAVEGDYFTILGLPLLPLIGWLRSEGLVAA